MKFVSVAAGAAALALSLSTAAHAAFPTFYTNASDFHAAGTIGYELMCALAPRVRVAEAPLGCDPVL